MSFHNLVVWKDKPSLFVRCYAEKSQVFEPSCRTAVASDFLNQRGILVTLSSLNKRNEFSRNKSVDCINAPLPPYLAADASSGCHEATVEAVAGLSRPTT